MNLELSDDATEYGHQARRAFESAGGDLLVQQAEAKPADREALVAPVLAELGAWDLEPRTDPDSLEAAAALCRSAGYWALPYPLAERLARPADLDVDGLIVVPRQRRRAPSRVCTTVGLQSPSTAIAASGGHRGDRSRLHRDVAGDRDRCGRRRRCGPRAGAAVWTLLGMLDRAVELTIAHVTLRKQFGQPLSSFQGVQFQLTDAEVERSGLDVLANTRCGPCDCRRCPRAATGRTRGRRGGLPGVPRTARRGGLLRGDHAVVALALQPAPAASALRPVGRPSAADPAAGQAWPDRAVLMSFDLSRDVDDFRATVRSGAAPTCPPTCALPRPGRATRKPSPSRRGGRRTAPGRVRRPALAG